jgi:uncharacterized protein YrrD
MGMRVSNEIIFTAKGLLGAKVETQDGIIGTISDLYFDDDDWQVRIMAIDASNRSQYPIQYASPNSAVSYDIDKGIIQLSLTRADLVHDPQILHGNQLHSIKKTAGFYAHGKDASIGHVEGFLIDPMTWRIFAAVINTRNWWFGREIVVDIDEIIGISWRERIATFDLDRDDIEGTASYVDNVNVDLKSEYQAKILQKHRHRSGDVAVQKDSR